MAKTKLVNAEIVVREEKPKDAPKQDLQAVLERMVRQRVDEILADRESALFEPEFRDMRTATAVMERQSVWYRVRWPRQFEKWGCRKCERKDVPHHNLGYCLNCHQRQYQRLKADKKEWDREHPQQPNVYRSLGADEETQTAKRVLGAMLITTEEAE